MIDLFARLLFAIAGLAGRLPWPWLRGCGDVVAWLWRRHHRRESKVALRNVELAYPELSTAEREALHADILRTTARQAFETLRLWTRPHARNLQTMLVRREGVDLFDEAIARGKGVIVAAPHYGNWELLNQWLADYTPLAILYRPPDSRLGEAFLRLARADNAGRVTQIRAEAAGIRQLFKRLRDGGVVGILPDQQPKAGDGEFAPFFGRPAYTMTLLHATGGAQRCHCAVRLLRARRPVGVRAAHRTCADGDRRRGQHGRDHGDECRRRADRASRPGAVSMDVQALHARPVLEPVFQSVSRFVNATKAIGRRIHDTSAFIYAGARVAGHTRIDA